MTRRREFPLDVRRDAWERSGGICECHRLAHLPGFTAEGCGRPLGPGNAFYEHVTPDGAGGKPTLANCAVLTKTCWRRKTDTYDQPKVAKTNRQADLARNIGPPPSSQPVPGSFRSGWYKPMRGPGVRRET